MSSPLSLVSRAEPDVQVERDRKGPQEGATLDFFRNGTMVGRVNVSGKEGRIEAVIRVEDTKIYSATRHPQTGQQSTRVRDIRLLNAKELVLADERGALLKMERAD